MTGDVTMGIKAMPLKTLSTVGDDVTMVTIKSHIDRIITYTHQYAHDCYDYVFYTVYGNDRHHRHIVTHAVCNP